MRGVESLDSKLSAVDEMSGENPASMSARAAPAQAGEATWMSGLGMPGAFSLPGLPTEGRIGSWELGKMPSMPTIPGMPAVPGMPGLGTDSKEAQDAAAASEKAAQDTKEKEAFEKAELAERLVSTISPSPETLLTPLQRLLMHVRLAIMFGLSADN